MGSRLELTTRSSWKPTTSTYDVYLIMFFKHAMVSAVAVAHHIMHRCARQLDAVILLVLRQAVEPSDQFSLHLLTALLPMCHCVTKR